MDRVPLHCPRYLLRQTACARMARGEIEPERWGAIAAKKTRFSEHGWEWGPRVEKRRWGLDRSTIGDHPGAVCRFIERATLWGDELKEVGPCPDKWEEAAQERKREIDEAQREQRTKRARG